MITLAGITLNNSLYLSGIESANLVAVTQNRTLTGESVVTVSAKYGGRTLTLTTMNDTALQGVWCKGVIDQLKNIEQAASSVTLDYQGTTYTVIIVSMEFEPLYQNEVESDTKKFTGSITLIEV